MGTFNTSKNGPLKEPPRADSPSGRRCLAAKVGSFSPALDLGKASRLGAIHAWNRAAVSGERPETGRWKTYSCGDYKTQLYCKSLGMVKFYQQKENNYFFGRLWWGFPHQGGYNSFYLATCKLVVNRIVNHNAHGQILMGSHSWFCQWQRVVLQIVSSIREKMTGKSYSRMTLSIQILPWTSSEVCHKSWPKHCRRYNCTQWVMLPLQFDDDFCRFVIKNRCILPWSTM